MSQERIERLVTDVWTIAEEWEEEPARKKIKEQLIDFARNVFHSAALYGYDNGLCQKQIDIESEMDKRGFLNSAKVLGEEECIAGYNSVREHIRNGTIHKEMPCDSCGVILASDDTGTYCDNNKCERFWDTKL